MCFDYIICVLIIFILIYPSDCSEIHNFTQNFSALLKSNNPSSPVCADHILQSVGPSAGTWLTY